MSLPSQSLRRAQLRPQQCLCTFQPRTPQHQQTRNATLLRRPQIPYTFTQLITLTNGSTFTIRTTSPLPVLRTTKDVYNHALWNPSLESLRNLEQDEAGRLKAFRGRYGMGWEKEEGSDGEEGEGEGIVSEGGKEVEGKKKAKESESQDSLIDLITEAAGVGKDGKR